MLRVSYIGYEEVVKELDLQSDYFGTIYLKESTTALAGVEVTANLNDPLFTTQTGKVSFTPELLNTEFSLLSSPDLVKSIQNLPGVSSGTELLSGLYVHGGRNDENMFLLDGTPLYQVNHLGGLFSAFNTDVVKNVDFYKSGFPARYGGRTASVHRCSYQGGGHERISWHFFHRTAGMAGSSLKDLSSKNKTSI